MEEMAKNEGEPKMGDFTSPPHRGNSMFGPLTYDECISKYVPDCETNNGVRLARKACAALFKDGSLMTEDVADCVLKDAIEAKTDNGVRLMYKQCMDRKKIRFKVVE